MSNKRIIAAMALAAALSASAEDLKTEITVDRTIVPVEREATRIGSLTPRLLSSPVNMRQLSLADYTDPAAITRSISTLDPATYADTFALSPYRGYASIGYFPVFNLGASAGYKFVDNSRTRFGAWLQYDGCSYDPDTDAEAEGRYSSNAVSVGAALDQRVGAASSFGARLAYTYSAIGLPDAFVNDRQNANIIDGDLSWWSRTGLIGYHAKASFSHFSYGKDYRFGAETNAPTAKAAGENRFNINGGISYFGSSAAPRGGIEIAADFISRSNGVEQIAVADGPGSFMPRFAPIADGTLGVISLTPYYAFNSGRVHGRIGAKIDVSAGGEGKKFHVAPAVMLDWNAASQFAIYARVNGGEHLNSLRSLYDYCPFVGGLWQYQRSHIPVTADLGMNIGPFSGFSARLFGGYAVANDWLMPQFADLSSSTGNAHFRAVNYGAYDLKGWHGGIGLSYEWRSVVKADVSAETASNGSDKAYYLWRDRAKYVIKASVEVRPVKALRLGAGYELRTDRHNYYYDGAFSYAYDLGAVSDLRFEASYAINDALTVFARGENLLNKRCDLVTTIQNQGVRGLVGAAYKF